jgi:L-ribulose-5-phosphate 4-epimerase
MALVEEGLVWHTFGNVSGVDREKGVVAIKPSGVDYSKLAPENIVLLSLDSGRVIDGKLNPSSTLRRTWLSIERSLKSAE